MSPDWQACSDGELAALSQAGQQAAFTEIMRRYRDPVYRLVRGYIGDADDALDVTQDIFAAAFQNLARYDRTRPLRPWLSRIAINKCRDWNRRARVRRMISFFTPGSASTIEAIVDDAPGAETATGARMELSRVEGAITRLPPPLREALLLRTIEGLSQAEAAEALGVTEKTVETRLYRARKNLSEILD